MKTFENESRVTDIIGSRTQKADGRTTPRLDVERKLMSYYLLTVSVSALKLSYDNYLFVFKSFYYFCLILFINHQSTNVLMNEQPGLVTTASAPKQ